jgi:nicotinate phosphoribosyltransferase
MAHSFITSFDGEIEAFRAFARTFPQNTVLLLDTYDTDCGALKAAQIGKEMAERGESLKGVRRSSSALARRPGRGENRFFASQHRAAS